MPMPISRASLEAECLRVTRKQQGCRGTHAVTIKRLHPESSGPNWEPQQFYPPLDKVAEHYACFAKTQTQAQCFRSSPAHPKFELHRAEMKSRRTGKPARYFKDFKYRTRRSWSRERRVVGKAEVTGGEANPRFVVISRVASLLLQFFADWQSNAVAA